ncbi:MAG: hypothetical protein ABEJ96_07300, partial [Thiohalorhabdaceae bacterium]
MATELFDFSDEPAGGGFRLQRLEVLNWGTSYVLGHYKTERGEEGLASRSVALRGPGHYTVLLAVFHNPGMAQTVTIAQVLWLREPQGSPERLYVVADQDLAIARDFAGFGSDMNDLKK